MSVPVMPGVTAKTITTKRLSTRVLFAGPEDGIPVLLLHGNMSSATVLFVLKEIRNHLLPEPGAGNILSCAFGPGLTLESMILEIIPAVLPVNDQAVAESIAIPSNA